MTFKTKLILFCFYQKKFLKCNFFTQNKNNIITCDNNKNTQNICCLHLCLLLKPVFYVTIFYRKVIKMFFFFGIMPYKKEIPYLFDCICPKCGKVCRYKVFLIGNCLSIFFIPLFRWGKQYFVKTECCGTIYSLKKEVGDKIRNGEDVVINSSDLTEVDSDYQKVSKCSVCGYECSDDFEYCPKCGNKLK